MDSQEALNKELERIEHRDLLLKVGDLEQEVEHHRGDHRMSWMETASGKKFDYSKPANIDLEDIATSLSRIPRFLGHTREFYSVAQHLLFCAAHAHPFYVVEVFTHDFAEAYVGDMPSPLKKSQPAYRRTEQRVQVAIRKRFGLLVRFPAEALREIKRVDLLALSSERAALKPGGTLDWGIKLPEPVAIEEQFIRQGPAEIRAVFLETCEKLGLE